MKKTMLWIERRQDVALLALVGGRLRLWAWSQVQVLFGFGLRLGFERQMK